MHALFRSRLDSAFAERIMIAVTSVNKCRYCSHLHAKIALENGSSPREIQMLLDGDISNCREGEAVALAFAQHYADSEEHPAKTSVQKLYTCYGRERARAILTYVQMITIGNLMGNTLDAFRSRLRGERPARPLSVFEFLSFLIGAPFGQLIMRK